jgi:phosphohistidine phosphatase
MDLILWRHAEAEPGEADLQRPLTARGQKQARKVGGWLDRHLPDKVRILCSPAVRTVQTAEALGRKFKLMPALAPDAAPLALLSAAHWPDAREAVLIIGHQPTLGQVASLLIGGTVQPWTLRKGSVWWISQHDGEDDAGNFIRAVITPDLAGM